VVADLGLLHRAARNEERLDDEGIGEAENGGDDDRLEVFARGRRF
jgi:hypothetical protein